MQIRFKATALIVLLSLTALSAIQSEDQRLLQKAKSMIFDKKYRDAIINLNEVIAKYPRSDAYSTAIFYKGKCLAEISDSNGALELYQKYLRIDKNGGFKEDAQIAVIDISYKLYSSEGKENLKNILQFLNSETDTVARYYAAFKLSYDKNKEIAKLGVPVLKEIILNEEDTDLRNRAKIAILRIDPSIMKDVVIGTKSDQKMVHFLIYNKERKTILVDMTVPVSLADLFINSLNENDINITDININGTKIKKTILEEIQKAKTGILTFETEDVIIKIQIN